MNMDELVESFDFEVLNIALENANSDNNTLQLRPQLDLQQRKIVITAQFYHI